MGNTLDGTSGSSVTYQLMPRPDKPGMYTIWLVKSPRGDTIARFDGRGGEGRALAYSEAYSYGYFSALALVKAGMVDNL